jgi:hypothetical protein
MFHTYTYKRISKITVLYTSYSQFIICNWHMMPYLLSQLFSRKWQHLHHIYCRASYCVLCTRWFLRASLFYDICMALNFYSKWRFCSAFYVTKGNGKCSRHSDWLRTGRSRGRSLSPGRDKLFLLSTSSRPVLGLNQLPIQWVPGALSPGVKRPGRESDHSPSIAAEAENTWIYTSIPPYVFMA